MMQFSDILVAPFDGLYGQGGSASQHRGGPIWPDWDTQSAARHCRAGQPVDDRPDPPEHWREIPAAHWGGPIVDHFGHMLAEYSMRLLPAALSGPKAPFLFYGIPPERYGAPETRFQATPRIFREIVAYAGLGPGDLHIETAGLKVGRLYVAPQAEQLGGIGPGAAHLDLLDDHAERMLGPRAPSGPVFISRAGQTARFAGEAYLELLLRARGVRVIRPETLALADQLKICRDAALVIFSEGSAMHLPQLLGRCLRDVVVFNRRPGDIALNIFSLGPRCQSLSYRSFLRGQVALLGPGGKPRRMFALSLICPERLREVLDDIGLGGFAAESGSRADGLWDETAFRAAEAEDVAAWLGWARQTRHWRDGRARAHLGETLARHFGHRFGIEEA